MVTNYKKVLLHLSLIDGAGPTVVQKICSVIKRDDLVTLYSYGIADFQLLGATERQAENLVQGLKDQQVLHNELALIEKHRASLITFLCDDYPYALQNIHLPPTVLYVWGKDLEDSRNYISLVGSRRAGFYTKQVVDMIVPPLVADNWITVSGGARGADSMVHQKTVDLNASTVVVLGSGLLNWYPPENEKLFEQVLEAHGTIVSIFPMEGEPSRATFPARNRVIAGLSRGTIVLQAAQKSGALITANFALEQGREVFALPGSVNDELSAGPHGLIKQGAHILTGVADIYEVFELYRPVKFQQSSLFQQPVIPEKFKLVLEIMNEPRSIDEIASMCQMGYAELHNFLFELQLDGMVEQNHAGLWERK